MRARRLNTRLDQVRRLSRVYQQLHQPTGVPSVHLANVACYSSGHFAAVFQQHTGETPGAFLRRRFLDRAAVQLIETNLPVTQIAFAAGFETHEGFTRAFRARFGVSPSSFRKAQDCPARGAMTVAFALRRHVRRTIHTPENHL